MLFEFAVKKLRTGPFVSLDTLHPLKNCTGWRVSAATEEDGGASEGMLAWAAGPDEEGAKQPSALLRPAKPPATSAIAGEVLFGFWFGGVRCD